MKRAKLIAIQIASTFASLLDGYGSFFSLDKTLSKLLLFVVSFLIPATGLMGMLGGLFVIALRRLFSLPRDYERLDTVNGILLGMLLGSLYAFSWQSVFVLFLGATLVIVAGAVLQDSLTRVFKLPLLGMPYVVAAYLLLPLGYNVLAPANHQIVFAGFENSFLSAFKFLAPFGAVYYSGTALGGILTFLAFAISSRYLALIGLAQIVVCLLIFRTLNLSGTDSLLYLVAQMNAVLTACIIGGLYTVPGKRSIAVALSSGIVACFLTISFNQVMWILHLPALALPFVVTTYAVILAFSPQQGGPWARFWLTNPCLAETSIEQMKIAHVRGVDPRSVALKAPFAGAWQVYQGFDGAHTHKGSLRYALDFFQFENGVSYKDDGLGVSDFYCYAKPVLSPAYGRVYECFDSFTDDLPGQVDTVNSFGNYIVIEIGFWKYVVLAHLQKDSMRVKAGDYLVPGQVLALCGNSGRSPQPHVHMHVQESPRLGSRTLPFHLTDVIVPDEGSAYYALNVIPKEKQTVIAPIRNHALKKAFKLSVGSRLEFDCRVGKNNAAETKCYLETALDPFGQFYLFSDKGASVAFTLNDDLVAFHNRAGKPDSLLDAFVLAVGLTPFVEAVTNWQDLTPIKFLPLPLHLRVLCAVFMPWHKLAVSFYERTWDSQLKRWVQKAEHKLQLGLIKWSCKTEVHLCESLGVLYLEVSRHGETLQSAMLAAQSIREDNGIPERSSACFPNT